MSYWDGQAEGAGRGQRAGEVARPPLSRAGPSARPRCSSSRRSSGRSEAADRALVH